MKRVLIASCLSIYFLAVFHASGLAQTPAGQTKEAVINNIRESFQKINTDQGLKTVELEGEEFLPDEAPDGGCSLKGYFKGGKRMDEAPSVASINELVSDVGPYSKLLQARWKKGK